MGYVRLKNKRTLERDIATMFGHDITMPVAERIMVRAKSLADARAVHSSVAGDIDFSVHANGAHTAVIMSVQGHHEDGSPSGQVASHLEFGYWNVWADRWIPGKHIMRDARNAA